MDIKKEKKAIKNLKAFLGDDWELTEEQKDALDDLTTRVLLLGKELAQAVPEGFVLVPKEPTEEMMFAGYESRENTDNLRINYKAMIAAQEQGDV